MINVTRTFFPPLEEYILLLKKIWENEWITNNGQMVVDLEKVLREYTGADKLFFASNGTIVLQMAIKALKLSGEIITTPFSYVATVNSILWEGCKPKFVDIKTDNFCINENLIEAAITKKTTAILATHVFGIPCNINAIESIATKHNLKVIYDAAHSFGCLLNGKSLLNYGDVSTCSFHATKVFHTAEGGCIITNNDNIAKEIRYMRQFGHVYDDYYNVGINGKNSELHAALGLVNINYVSSIISNRKFIFERYHQSLAIYFKTINIEIPGFLYNYAYYPILFKTEDQLIDFENKLLENEIRGRRYFYPSLNLLPFLSEKQSCPVSEDISSRIYCLPVFYGMEFETIDKIIEIAKMYK